MNQKPSPLAALAAITPEQADELFDRLRTMPYYAAVAWVAQTWGLTVSISGLRRWWQRESAARARADLRSAIRASEQFDKDLDARALDQRAAHALRAAFWQAVTAGDAAAVKTFGAMVLDYNADGRGVAEIEIKRQAQATRDEQLRLARDKFEAAESRLSAAKAAVERLNQSGGLTAEARAEIEKAMGML